jgi:hypothetical protein
MALLMSLAVFSQTRNNGLFDLDDIGLQPDSFQPALSNITINGYYRFMGTYTVMQQQYPEFQGVSNRLFLGDDSNLPQLSLNIGVSPTSNTSISTELYMWTPLTGLEDDYVQGLLLGLNLQGTHSTEYGTFTVRTGGIHWHELSPMTFASVTGYNRYSVFERNPWDPNTATMRDRYSAFYENGALTQDERWGQQAFHGLILQGVGLPKDLSFSFMHGKSQLNGGAAPLPNNLTGGRIQKGNEDEFISINVLRSKTYSDSTAEELVGFNFGTTEFGVRYKDILRLQGEVGLGNYFAPDYSGQVGEAIDLRFQFQKSFTRIPVELRYFRISPNVINNNGIFFNTSIQEYVQVEDRDVQTPLLFPFASSLTFIGQLTNNREGLILNTDLEFGKHKFSVGYSMASEIIAASDHITYGHPANSLQLSRFWRWDFPTQVGPYDNLNKIYRNVYETVYITDSVSAKGFNSIEVNYKSKWKLLQRDLYVFYLGAFHSVQRDFSVLPQYNRSSYLQSFNHQLELYYALTPKIVLSNYLAYDRILGGENTERDLESLGTKDQEGMSYAIGLDIELAKNTGLYLRHRWMSYQDFSYAMDRYRGAETSVELKIFF